MPDSPGHAGRGNRAAGLLVDCLKCVVCSALVELLPSILQEVTMPAATTDRSSSASISADGQVVAFESEGALVAEDGGFPVDVFVHDEQP
jgi:hypothetical protein